MLAKKIKYVDFNGVEREETHYFNLTRSEAIEYNWSVPGGIQEILERIVAEQDIKQILEHLKEILSRAYGVKSPDGRTIDKDPQHWKTFVGSMAYDELFMELITDPNYAGQFIRSIVPSFPSDHETSKSE